MLLSILIPTISVRSDLMDQLMRKISLQVHELSKRDGVDFWERVQILRDPRDKVSIGTKRNDLLSHAEGKYVCFVDDDDEVAEDYVETILTAIQSDPDCLSIRGIMTSDGKNPEVFEHSINYPEWRTTDNPIKYERYPNHLNVIRKDIAIQFRFPETSFGEDKAWSDQVHQSGLLKTEVYIDKVLYYYIYRSKK